jgi:hypothetical protein
MRRPLRDSTTNLTASNHPRVAPKDTVPSRVTAHRRRKGSGSSLPRDTEVLGTAAVLLRKAVIPRTGKDNPLHGTSIPARDVIKPA